MSRDNEEVTPQRLVGLKECNNSTAKLSYFYTYKRRHAKISDLFPLGGFPVRLCSPGQVSEELGAHLLPLGKLVAMFSKAAKALSPCSSKVAAAATVTERFWKAGFSGSILPLEEGRDSTSASLKEDKREEE